MRQLRLSATRRAVLAAFCATTSAARSAVPGHVAHPADQFVESVGVCTHLASAPYNQQLDTLSHIVDRLGVRHLRDEIRPTNDVAAWRRFAESSNARFHLLVSPATNTPREMLDFLRALGPAAVSAVEGQNEGDSPWFKAQDSARPDWAEVVVRYQRETLDALRGGREFSGIPILSPTVLDYQPDDMRRIRGAAAFSDVVALHAYLQGQQPPETVEDYAGIDWYLKNMRDPFKPGAPVMVTETGYATGAAGISQQAASVYLPRLLLHLYDRGIKRSFIYEFLDEGSGSDDPEQNYGLLSPKADPKPAFHTLKLLLNTLSDRGSNLSATPLSLAVEQSPSDCRLMAFRKRDGEVILALWRAASVWDPASKRDVDSTSGMVRLRLPPCSRAVTRSLTHGDDWITLAVRGSRIELPVGATVVLVRLSP